MLSERRSVGEYVIYLQLLFHGIVVSHTILSLNSKEAKYPKDIAVIFGALVR